MLEQKQVIYRETRKGHTSVFRIRPLTNWETPVHKKDPAIPGIRPCDKRSTGTCDIGIPTEGTPTKDIPLRYSPAQRDDPLFVSTWEKWMEYRRGLRSQPKNSGVMFNEQLAWLAGFPNDVATEIIQQSLRNGWQGLFPPKGSGGARHAARTPEETHADHAQGF